MHSSTYWSHIGRYNIWPLNSFNVLEIPLPTLPWLTQPTKRARSIIFSQTRGTTGLGSAHSYLKLYVTMFGKSRTTRSYKQLTFYLPMWHDDISLFLMPRSHQTFRSVLTVKLLGVTLRNTWWPTTFLTITAGDADGWCRKCLVWIGPSTPTCSWGRISQSIFKLFILVL